MKEAPDPDAVPLVREAVNNYFRYRGDVVKMEFGQLMKQGRISLVIGIAFLTTCLFVRAYFLADVRGPLMEVLRESLAIAGWVAMWQPMQTYLYDWWPLRRRSRVFAKLSQIPVELVGPSERAV